MRKHMLLLVTVMAFLGTTTYIRPPAAPARHYSGEPSLQTDASFRKQEKWWDKVWPQRIGQ